jgi:hypothetical protein
VPSKANTSADHEDKGKALETTKVPSVGDGNGRRAINKVIIEKT